jgi:putative transposase
MIDVQERTVAVQLIAEAVESGARASEACAILGLSPKTLRRWCAQVETTGTLADQRKAAAATRVPANKLTVEEKQVILETVHQPEFRSLPPSQIVPMLADRGEYRGSESSFYRVMSEQGQNVRRGRAASPRTVAKPQGFCAEGPNEVWSWDITYLPTRVKGIFLRLYVVEDVFSRKITGWEVHAEESAEHASALIHKACLVEGIQREGLVLHADNGSAMRSATLLAKLQHWGITPSFSRPAVSNDNPYIEATFRTLKYTPRYPSQPFADLAAARAWVAEFVEWYNEQHRHSAIHFVTPGQRHRGEDHAILAQRHEVYEDARSRNPQRWSGATRNWNRVEQVWLNPPAGHATEATPASEAA